MISVMMKTEDIKAIAEPVLAARDLFLVDVKVSRDNVVELLIDSMAGVNIQTCVEVSREIEGRLDREKEDFELTVASAGIGYPFKVEQQYAKNIGKKVEVKLKEGKNVAGILKAFDADTVVLEWEEKRAVEGSKKKQLVKVEETIRRGNVKEIRDVVVW